jgi:hypothetical protein
MNNNIDIFIKYLDENLSNIERKSFEEQLLQNSQLKAEFEHFNQLYSSNKNNISLDERYFNTLIPNAKKKILESKPIWKNKYVLVLPILIIGLVILLSLPETTNENENFNQLIEIASIDDQVADDIISANPIYYMDDRIIPELYGEDLILDSSVFDYLDENLNITEINNDLVDSFSDSEFMSVYEQIFDKNIVGKK